jgi:hypothetical protein
MSSILHHLSSGSCIIARYAPCVENYTERGVPVVATDLTEITSPVVSHPGHMIFAIYIYFFFLNDFYITLVNIVCNTY